MIDVGGLWMYLGLCEECCPPAKYVVSAFGVVLWCCMNVVRINVHVCVCVGSVRISSQRHDMFVCVHLNDVL